MAIPSSSQRIDPQVEHTHLRHTLARGLGWFSLALGGTQLVAPARLSGALGLHGRAARWTLRGLGIREIASGTLLLSSRQPATYAWTRVVGDLMDAALLTPLWRSGQSGRGRLIVLSSALGGVTILDLAAASAGGSVVNKSVTIGRPLEQVSSSWLEHDSERAGPGRKRAEDNGRSSLKGPAAVSFTPAPGERGTEVRVQLLLSSAENALASTVGRLLHRSPQQKLAEELRRFKQVVETGEAIRSDGRESER